MNQTQTQINNIIFNNKINEIQLIEEHLQLFLINPKTQISEIKYSKTIIDIFIYFGLSLLTIVSILKFGKMPNELNSKEKNKISEYIKEIQLSNYSNKIKSTFNVDNVIEVFNINEALELYSFISYICSTKLKTSIIFSSEGLMEVVKIEKDDLLYISGEPNLMEFKEMYLEYLTRKFDQIVLVNSYYTEFFKNELFKYIDLSYNE
jgi:hypothetical protein